MILERKMKLDIPEFENNQEFNFVIEGYASQRDAIINFSKFMQIYDSAMKEVSTKLEILDDEFQIQHSHNPIHHLERRVKSFASIASKLSKITNDFTIENVRENIKDIAGIRVICNYVEDIYLMESLLLKQTDIKLVVRKDYIENPKPSGYRSLHIIVEIPVFLSDSVELVPVEIQMRTVAMDYWASLEHKLRYKSKGENLETHAKVLLDCANTLAQTEELMQGVHLSLNEKRT